MKGNQLNRLKYIMTLLLQNAAFATATGAIIYLASPQSSGFSRLDWSLLVAGIMFVIMPCLLMGIALLDEYLNRRSQRSV